MRCAMYAIRFAQSLSLPALLTGALPMEFYTPARCERQGSRAGCTRHRRASSPLPAAPLTRRLFGARVRRIAGLLLPAG